jgi:hypothetical protein
LQLVPQLTLATVQRRSPPHSVLTFLESSLLALLRSMPVHSYN